MNEQVTATRKYRGHEIRTITQPSGRKTFDIYEPAGGISEIAAESFAVAKAIVDADIESKEQGRG